MLWALFFSLFAPLSAHCDVYYDQLFADGKFDITIALSFEQKKADTDIPILKQVGDVIKAPQRDDENTARDVENFEATILGCAVCHFQKQGQGVGYRIYVSDFSYNGRPIHARLKFLYSEPGVEMSALKKAFIAALGSDDVISYVGHSRSGHGFPDFGSPLADTGKVYVDDTVQGWLGFEKGYFAHSKYQLLVLNACQTERYYKRLLRTHLWEKDPTKLGMILSTDDTWFEDYADTTGALLYGLFTQASREQILEAMDEEANQYHLIHMTDPVKKKLFTGDGFFDSTYTVKATPKRIVPREPWRDMPF